ncbi:MAG: glycosyltransferase [Bacteroidota bacterium]
MQNNQDEPATMKNIVAISPGNTGGGAEKVAYTICKELHLRGYNSKMLARKIDYSADPLVKEFVQPVPGPDLLYSAGNLLDDIFSTQYLFYLSTWRIPFLKLVRQSDVIHLHNIHGYYFNLLALPTLMNVKPVVWTLYDMWAFTGKCVWSFDCERYAEHCGNCPQLSAYPVMKHDRSRFQLGLKKMLYANKKFVIVAPSAWLQSHVNNSILRDVPSFVIPSSVDTKIFFPEDKSQARKRMGIPQDKKVILFIASWINSIQHKGIDTFKELLSILYKNRTDIYTLIVGHLQGKSVLGDEYAGKETGWVSDPDILRACYSSADIFVSPTLADNSPCTVVEAMACGTAVVAYKTGGIPEQVNHGETGWLVRSGDKKALFDAIVNLLDDPEKRNRFGKAGSKRVLDHFTLDIFIKKYIDVSQEAMRLKR